MCFQLSAAAAALRAAALSLRLSMQRPQQHQTQHAQSISHRLGELQHADGQRRAGLELELLLDFALHLLMKHHVAVVPGSAYGQTTDRFVRISIGTETEARIQKALSTIASLSRVNQFDRDSHVEDLVDAGVDLGLAGVAR